MQECSLDHSDGLLLLRKSSFDSPLYGLVSLRRSHLSYRTRLERPCPIRPSEWLFSTTTTVDILAVNGEVQTIEALARAKDPYPLHQPNQRNLANGQFEDVTHKAGSVFELSEVSRGAAFGDVDNDGDTDVLVVNNNGRSQALAGSSAGGQDGKARRAGRPTLWRRARADGSYASANDPRVLVGLGDSTDVTAVRAYWPSGRVEEWTDVSVDRYTTLREASGKPVR